MFHHDDKMKYLKGVMSGFVLGLLGSYVVYKNRRSIKSKIWMIKAKAEIFRRLDEMADVTKDAYGQVVDEVLSKYRTAKHIAGGEIEDFKLMLNDKWDDYKRKISERFKEDDESDE